MRTIKLAEILHRITEVAAVQVAGQQYSINVKEEQFQIQAPGGQTYRYRLTSGGWVSVTIPVIDLRPAGTDFQLTYKHPVTRSTQTAPVKAEKITQLVQELGQSEIRIEIVNPEDGSTTTLEFVKA